MRIFRKPVTLALALAVTTLAQAPQTPPAAPAPAPQQNQGAVVGGMNFKNGAPLLDVIDDIANELKLSYVLDPSVKGGTVIMNTYGVVRDLDLREILETILRMNNLAMVEVGGIYRIGPAKDVQSQPITPVSESSSAKIADDDRLVMNLVFLHYMASSDMVKVLEPFEGQGAQIKSYDPANLLIILDNGRNMRRTLDLINMFDSESFASQRVRSFDVKNRQPDEIKKDLDEVFKAYALSNGAKSGSAVQFVALDQINEILAVAPNPEVFKEVETWLAKFDVPAKTTAGAVENNVYHLKYQRAEVIGMAVGQLYGIPVNNSLSMLAGSLYGGASTAYPATTGVGGAGYGGVGYGGGGAYGGGYGGGYGSQYGGGAYGQQQYGMQPQYQANPFTQSAATGAPGSAGTAAGATPGTTGGAMGTTPDMTGMYLGNAGYAPDIPGRPRIVPNPIDNTVLVRSTPEQWEEIRSFMEKLDVSPRQVLIEAKIYEVDLTGNLTAGVEAFLQKQSGASRQLTGSSAAGSLLLSAGTMVGQARELLATLNATELVSKAKVLSSPTLIATDSIPASINVGDSVPTLSSQGVNPGVTSGGNSLFTNTITNVSTGTGLNILARVNPSGVVTMVINQTVTAPSSTTTSTINSPSFSQRNVSTQVTVDDGDMVAIGGIIDETTTNSSNGIPFLDRIPGLSFLFSTHSTSKQRTELIVFLTPHVIYDTHKITDATQELKDQMKGLKDIISKNP